MAKARTLVIKIVVNKKERDFIADRAKFYGMSASGFARLMAMQGIPVGDSVAYGKMRARVARAVKP